MRRWIDRAAVALIRWPLPFEVFGLALSVFCASYFLGLSVSDPFFWVVVGTYALWVVGSEVRVRIRCRREGRRVGDIRNRLADLAAEKAAERRGEA